MIEAILRRIFKAPITIERFEENTGFPNRSVALPELTRLVIGVEPGDHVYVANLIATVYDGETPEASTDIIGYLGHGPHPVRRRVAARLARHLTGAAWTLAGMLIVLLTLTGTVQAISFIICLIFFTVDLMTISIRRR